MTDQQPYEPAIIRESPGSAISDARVASGAPWDLRSRVMAIVSGVGALVVLAGSLTALASDPLGNAKLADRFPADTVAYVEVNARGLIDGIGPLLAALEPVLGPDAVSTDDLLDEREEEFGLSLRDVLTWATGRAAYAIAAEDLSGSDGQMPGLAIVEGRDQSALRTFLDQLVTDLAVEGKIVQSVDIGDTPFHVLDLGVEEGNLIIGQDGKDLLLASSEAPIERVLRPTSSLADDSAFLATRDAMPSGADVFIAFDLSAMAEQFGLDPAMFEGAPADDPAVDLLTGLAEGWAATSFEISPSAISGTTVTPAGNGDAAIFGAGDQLLTALPGDAVAYVRLRGSASFRSSFALFGTANLQISDTPGESDGPPLPVGPGVQAELDRFASTVDAIAALFDVDGGVVVSPAPDESGAIPHVTAVGIASQPAQPLLDRATQLINEAEGLPADDNPFEPALAATRDTLTVLSTDPTVVKEPPQLSLRESPLLASARRAVPGVVTVAIDIPAIVELVSAAFTPVSHGPAPAPRDVTCQPFTLFASSTQRRGDQSVTTFHLAFERPDDTCAGGR